MSWGLLDDEFWRNKKVVALSPQAFRLYVVAIVFERSRVDLRRPTVGGRLTAAELQVLAVLHRVAYKKSLTELVQAHCFEPVEGSAYKIHDYEDVYAEPDRRARLQVEKAQRAAGVRWKGDAQAYAQASLFTDAQAYAQASEQTMHEHMLRAGAPETETETETEKINKTPNGVLLSETDALFVFACWTESTGKTQSKLLPQRRQMMERRILEGYSVKDLADAVRGHVNDPWPGRKNELDMKYLIGSGERVEKFAKLYRDGRPVPAMGKPGGASERAATWGQLAEKLRKDKPKELDEHGS